MKLHISLGEHSYDILLLRGGLSRLSEYINLNRRVMLVTDKGVPGGHVNTVLKQLPQGFLFTAPQGESAKSFPIFEKLCSALLSARFSRNDLILALGGGVVGDLAGYAAASYMRGIDFINLPTTTLSQIDSSIGGKTAINLDGVKNIIGAFHQPRFVLVDSDTLQTLPARHFYNGLVEAVKAGLIGDPELFALFEREDISSRIDEIILRALRVKQRVVEEDETEQGLRKILNFGHTIGHGVESIYGLEGGLPEGLLHGEAVAIGMLPMIEDVELRERTRQILHRLSIRPDMEYNAEQVYDVMTRDKKARSGAITVVLVRQCGEAILKEIPLPELRRYLAGGEKR